MGYEYEVEWLGIIQFVFFIGFGLVVYFSRKNAAKAAELEKVINDVNSLKEQIKHLPDCKQITKIETDMAGISQQLVAMNSTLRLLHEHILNSSK